MPKNETVIRTSVSLNYLYVLVETECYGQKVYSVARTTVMPELQGTYNTLKDALKDWTQFIRPEDGDIWED